MKGIIFNLLEDFIEDSCGTGVYAEILAGCTLTTADPDLIVGPGTYPDSDFVAIIDCLVCRFEQDAGDVLRAFGKYAVPRLAERYPQFFVAHSTPREFLKSVGFIHHIEIKKLYKDADTPVFSVEDRGVGPLVMKYRSNRRLCHFVEGLVDGLAEQYHTPIGRVHSRCQLNGDPECVFHLSFEE